MSIDASAGLSRRDALRVAALAAIGLGVAPAFWRTSRAAAAATAGAGPYGPLQAPDGNGIRLPRGFRSRVIAHGRLPVPGTSYRWHDFSDGAAIFGTPDGGWILVSNSETAARVGGGASAIRFDAAGRSVDAYRILGGTHNNCAGGPTPWGTWLSCEEHEDGLVWECDPTGAQTAVARPAMGRFNHEAAAVDPGGRAVYLTEDEPDGGFYRFTPRAYPDLSEGRLEVAVVGGGGRVRWVRVPEPDGGAANPTRRQVPEMTAFERGEGIWFHAGTVYVATTRDSKIHAYDTRAGRMRLVYDKSAIENPPLLNPDNLTVSSSGDIFVGEDSGGDDPLDLGIITPEGEVARFLKLTGVQHGTGELISEIAGPVFDPSGTRLYFASQRAFGLGQIYEVSGPFREPAGGRQRDSGPPPAPLIGVAVAGRRTRGAVLRHGIPVAVTLDAPAEVTITVRTVVRSGGGRRRTVTLGRLSEPLERGAHVVPVGLTASARRRLRNRSRSRLVVDITLVHGAGVRRLRRTVRVAPSAG